MTNTDKVQFSIFVLVLVVVECLLCFVFLFLFFFLLNMLHFLDTFLIFTEIKRRITVNQTGRAHSVQAANHRGEDAGEDNWPETVLRNGTKDIYVDKTWQKTLTKTWQAVQLFWPRHPLSYLLFTSCPTTTTVYISTTVLYFNYFYLHIYILHFCILTALFHYVLDSYFLVVLVRYVLIWFLLLLFFQDSRFSFSHPLRCTTTPDSLKPNWLHLEEIASRSPGASFRGMAAAKGARLFKTPPDCQHKGARRRGSW